MKITIKDFFNNPPPEKWWKKVKREIKIQLWCWSIEINHFLKKKNKKD